ncbi:hypothetical protein C6N75_09810 [Streptomyces solincola]|uniref:Uncharacterized protein n=1 Tax=Streptomyces solincola TaxID=2100817 RepID=A0A2S9PY76_9ACTN|nr:hypothetical protein [Streptomyces solincola]PRH79370.1 hypothetical protein C6N75_09810 [Streptomyces solincola]
MTPDLHNTLAGNGMRLTDDFTADTAGRRCVTHTVGGHYSWYLNEIEADDTVGPRVHPGSSAGDDTLLLWALVPGQRYRLVINAW